MSLRICLQVCAVALLAGCTDQDTASDREEFRSSAWLIRDALVIDGTGSDGYVADVRLRDGLIVELGELQPQANEQQWQANGLALAPGFIDPHSHHADDLSPDAAYPSVLAQGITTVIGGADGDSGRPLIDVFAAFEAAPAAFNLAYFGGHNTYRTAVMPGENRPATRDELAAMRNLLEDDLSAGALGLSTGLEYEPGLHANTDEVIELARTAARAGGRYSSHIRSEDVALLAAVDELIAVAKEANLPAHMSHMKVAMSSKWGSAGKIVEMLDAAAEDGLNISGDVYPYDGWQTTMQVLLPQRNFQERAAYEYALAEIAPPDRIIISKYSPEPALVGRTLAEIATEKGEDPVDTLQAILLRSIEEGGDESIIGRSMGEDDIATFLQWPGSSITSDGGVDDRHPRGQGAFPRVLKVYVRELGILRLPEAIAKMTGKTADSMGITDRGRIHSGLAADLVLFDPSTVADHADFEEPLRYSTGIEAVWVNGELVWREGAATEARSGEVLRRQ